MNVWGERTIALLEREREEAVTAWIDGRWKSLELLDIKRAVAAIDARIERIKSGELPRRPRRTMTTLRLIGMHHGLQFPACRRCGIPAPTGWRGASAWLERAHMIDRYYGGLDLASNLMPLCAVCHASQPSFRAGDEAAARAWFGLPPLEYA